LPVVEEAEVALRIVVFFGGGSRGQDRRDRPLDHGAPFHGPVVMHEGTDAIERDRGDASAIAQAAYELAVIDGAAAEGRFGETRAAAIIGDFLEYFLGLHGLGVPRFSRAMAVFRHFRALK